MLSHDVYFTLKDDSDEAIADLVRRSGVPVPFLRPPELARDDSPMLPVVRHALSWMLDHGDEFDAVCLMQPTCPLRRPDDIDACVGRFLDGMPRKCPVAEKDVGMQGCMIEVSDDTPCKTFKFQRIELREDAGGLVSTPT